MIIADFFKLNSRLGRVRYIGLLSFNASLIIALYAITLIAKMFDLISSAALAPIPFLAAIYFTSITFLNIRRIHDFDYNGWYAIPLFISSILLLIPSILLFTNIIIPWPPKFIGSYNTIFELCEFFQFGYLILCLVPGTKNNNRFGKHPENPTIRDYCLIMSMPITLIVVTYSFYLISESSILDKTYPIVTPYHYMQKKY